MLNERVCIESTVKIKNQIDQNPRRLTGIGLCICETKANLNYHFALAVFFFLLPLVLCFFSFRFFWIILFVKLDRVQCLSVYINGIMVNFARMRHDKYIYQVGSCFFLFLFFFFFFLNHYERTQLQQLQTQLKYQKIKNKVSKHNAKGKRWSKEKKRNEKTIV